jgi:integrase
VEHSPSPNQFTPRQEANVAEHNPTIPEVPPQPLPIDAPEPKRDAADDLSTMTFRQACHAFLETRRPFLSPRTWRGYEYFTKRLCDCFGTKRLPEITADHLRKYQRLRSEKGDPNKINQELSVVVMMLKRIGCWEKIGLSYQRLPLRKTRVGRAMTDDEERRLFRAGASNPRWEAAYMFAILSLHTTMGPGEIISLRRKNIDLEKNTVSVGPEGAKNSGRIRLIPLNEIGIRVCREALSVAEKKGSVLPEHYLFPFRHPRGTGPNRYDHMRPATTFKTAWTEMLKAAGIEKLRPYDLRHTAITRLCENPHNAEEVVEAIAGHITHDMKKRYSHVRVEARRAALAGLVPERLDKAYPIPGSTNTGNGPARTGKPLNNQDVLGMVEAGLPPKVLVAKIDRSPGNYDTTPDALKQLKTAGVHDSVILAMVRAG